MTSEIAAAGLEPAMAELRQIRESIATLATKAELRQMRESIATLATKAELRQMRESMVTKADLAGLTTNLEKTETNLRREMAERETRLIKWMFGAMLAQTAVIVGFVVGVVPFLK